MAHFGFVAPPLPGHYNPLCAVAGELVRRGHRVTFVHQPDAARWLHGAPVSFAAVGAATHPPGALDAAIARMARLQGAVGLRTVLRDVARSTDMLCRELPAALRALGVDAVVADQAEAAGALVAEHLQLPCVSTATALPLNREPDVPPPFLDWPYDPSERGRRRNRGAQRVADWLMRPVDDVIAAHARHWRLGGRRRADEFFSPLAQLAQAVRGLDYPRRALPPSFRYLGPFRPPQPDADHARQAVELAEQAGSGPLVFCSLGTLQGSRAWIFRRVAQACADLGAPLVVAHGGLLDAAQAAALPGRPVVRDYVPQRALLARASVAVTHAGFNTVLDALTCGVPMVAVPLAFEQPGTAARLRRAGVAEVLSTWRLGRRALADALRRMLDDGPHRQAADALRREIAASAGTVGAADAIEAVVGRFRRG